VTVVKGVLGKKAADENSMVNEVRVAQRNIKRSQLSDVITKKHLTLQSR
jgi:hypothetical protein